MFGIRKKKEDRIKFDPDLQTPVLRCSICNGERVAGFKDKKTGAFTEAKLITTDAELENFLKIYGISEIKKEY